MTSGFPPKADIVSMVRHVRKVPAAEMAAALSIGGDVPTASVAVDTPARQVCAQSSMRGYAST